MLSVNEIETWLWGALEQELYWIGLCMLLVLGMAWNGWAIYEAFSALTVEMPRTLPVSQPVSHLNSDFFGNYVPNGDALAMAQLDETIVGILFSADPQQSQVILRGENGFDKIYHVGDTLKSGIVIYAIRSTGIILSDHGKFERLEMVKKKLQLNAPLKPLKLKDSL